MNGNVVELKSLARLRNRSLRKLIPVVEGREVRNWQLAINCMSQETKLLCQFVYRLSWSELKRNPD